MDATTLLNLLTLTNRTKEELINKLSSRDLRKVHNNNENWKKFARRLQKNEFMRSITYRFYLGMCAWCKKPLGTQFVIHHIDYDNECDYNKTISVAKPTKNRPTRVRKNLPDCETCLIQSTSSFDRCFGRIVPVHGYCNKAIWSETVKRKMGCFREVSKRQSKAIPKINKLVASLRKEYPNAYQPWTSEEIDKLKTAFSSGKSITELAALFGRQPSAIESRLLKSNLLNFSRP